MKLCVDITNVALINLLNKVNKNMNLSDYIVKVLEKELKNA